MHNRDSPRGVGTLARVSYMHHFRRQAHRAAKLPRRTWQRVYTYNVGEVPSRPGMKIYQPVSRDAPYSHEDALLFDWILAISMLVTVIGFAIWGITAWT
jgi:hypothetical protein